MALRLRTWQQAMCGLALMLGSTAHGQDVFSSGTRRQRDSSTTGSQTRQPCETQTNGQGGTRGRTSDRSGNQNPWTNPRRPDNCTTVPVPNDRGYILPGGYDVFEGAWNNGDSQGGFTDVYRIGPGKYQLVMKSGRAVMEYVGPDKSGAQIYIVKATNQRLAFHRLPGASFVVAYDVWWIGAGKNGKNVVETWHLRG